MNDGHAARLFADHISRRTCFWSGLCVWWGISTVKKD